MLLFMLIVKIDPSKDTEKYIADDEAVQSNIKFEGRVIQLIHNCAACLRHQGICAVAPGHMPAIL